MSSSFVSRTRRLFFLVCVVSMVGASVVVAGPASAAAATLGLTKTASRATAGPGTNFNYTLVAQCSGLTVGCVDAVLTDVIPAEVVVDTANLPPSNATPSGRFTTTP